MVACALLRKYAAAGLRAVGMKPFAAGGGDGETEGAVHLALDWLARHQEADGTWNSRRFVKRCQGPGCGRGLDEEYVSATTAIK